MKQTLAPVTIPTDKPAIPSGLSDHALQIVMRVESKEDQPAA
jgi:hypothetical protein